MTHAWSDRFDVGDDEMDQEHRTIVSKMNRIEELARQRVPKPELAAAIDELERTAAQHFADEEALMAEIGFPGLASHRHVHGNMLQKYRSFSDAFAAGDGDLPHGFLEFLNFWLRVHLAGIDHGYANRREPARATIP